MIHSLRGEVIAIDHEADFAVIDVNGVGYRVFCDTETLGALAHAKQPQTVLCEMHVREDHIHLYGFLEEAQRQWFRILITVKGVGTKAALAILATTGAAQLGMCIAAKDEAQITRANGVGPKLAARIIAELQGHVSSIAAPAAADRAAGAGDADSTGAGMIEDAVMALEQLGVERRHAYATCHRLVQAADGAALDTATLVRLALKQRNS